MTALAEPTTALSFNIGQPPLLKVLKLVGRVISPKSFLPEIGCFLFDVKDGTLTVTGTDLELAISARLGVPMASDGQILIPARLLSEFVDSLRGGDLVLNQKAGTRTVAIKSGRNEANLNGMDTEGYPTVFTDDLEATATVRILARVLRTCINDTVFATAPDDTRPVLSGLLVQLADGMLTMAAADGYRLAVRSESVGTEAEQAFTLLAPAKGMRHLAALLPDDDTIVEIAVATSKNQVRFSWGDVVVSSRLIEGQFPDYTRIIPTDCPTRMEVPIADLLAATKVAMVFSRDNSNLVRLSLAPGDSEADDSLPGRCTVSATSREQGDGTTDLEPAVEGPANETALNGRYLRDALAVMGNGEVVLEMTGPTTPVLLRPLGRTNCTHVIMPMHTEGGR